MIYSTGNHIRFYHRYHVVWVPKYCFKVLGAPMAGVHIEKGGLSPHLVPSKVMMRVKGRSPASARVRSPRTIFRVAENRE